MTIQRSDCCKATIDLDKTKERPKCYTCSECGRIIGSPLPTQQEEIEKAVETICNCRHGAMDEKQFRATVEHNLTSLTEAHKVEMGKLYSYLLSKEAVIAKGGIQSEYENGYFDAIDDLAKHISQEFNIEVK